MELLRCFIFVEISSISHWTSTWFRYVGCIRIDDLELRGRKERKSGEGEERYQDRYLKKCNDFSVF